jgi:hypothetical protein
MKVKRRISSPLFPAYDGFLTGTPPGFGLSFLCLGFGNGVGIG